MQNKTLVALKYSLILFDADGTLFDYDMAEGIALTKTFEKYCFVCSEDIRNKYRKINSSMWKDFENGRIDKAAFQAGRFERLLSECGYEADAHEFNLLYLDILAGSGHLMSGALEICKELSQFCTLAIATNGVSKTQRGRLANSLIHPYVSHVIISEDAGCQKPHGGFFEYAFDVCKMQDKKTTMIVGDSLGTDMKGGIDSGIATCWYNPAGVSDNSGMKIDYEIRNLLELRELIV